MPVPDFQRMFLPLLRAVAKTGSTTPREAKEFIAKQLELTDDDRRVRLASGNQFVFDNRVGWARTYLKKAGIINSPRRGIWEITDRGREILARPPSTFDVRYLNQFPEFVEFHNTSRSGDNSGNADEDTSLTADIPPEELFAAAHHRLTRELIEEIRSAIANCTSGFFERLVVQVLVAMGYGGSQEDAGRAVGRSGDGGIDGIIKEDRLGLETIYIQAKRWEPTVGRPEIQKFAGALQMHRARKGVFITSSSFSQEALDYVSRIDSKIVLIDGAELSRLMIEYEIGVDVETVYKVKRLNSDYFNEG